MKHIYSGARTVVIWLGESGDDSAEAFRLLNNFDLEHDSFGDEVLQSVRRSSCAAGWAALSALLQRSWWKRAWIFQEIILAKTAEVWCGADSCSWDVFAAIAEVMEENRAFFLARLPALMANHHHLYNLALYKKQYVFMAPPSLSEALQIRRQAGSTDPRDKVYALLGVCREEQALTAELRGGLLLQGSLEAKNPESEDLRIDYAESHTVAKVYRGAARHIIEKCEHLELLSACQNPDRRDGIPSWTPDWSTPRNNMPIVSPDEWGRYFSASAGRPLLFRRGQTPDEIILKCVVIDAISEVGSLQSGSDPKGEVVSKEWLYVLSRAAQARPDGKPFQEGDTPYDGNCLYRDGSTMELVTNRTLLMDRIVDYRVGTMEELTAASDAMDTESKMRVNIARRAAVEGRRVATTRTGYVGLFPAEVQEQDIVVVIIGADVPFVVRVRDDLSRQNMAITATLVGECYVHGVMYGEAMDPETALPMDHEEMDLVLT